MNLSQSDLTHLCSVAIEAATSSGVLIQSHVGRSFKAKSKDAGSSAASQIVTEVDLKSQDNILSYIHPTLVTFDLGLLIEESIDDGSRFEKDYFWCIDPLDGTLPFTQQEPGYSVSVGLVSREGVPVIGVVYDPSTQTLYHAIRGGGAYRNHRPWVLAPNENDRVTNVEKGGAVMNACWVLEQAPAYFMKQPKPQDGGGSLWDYAATACLYEEIGGFASDSFGNGLNLNSGTSLYMNRTGVLFASHRDIARSVKLAPANGT